MKITSVRDALCASVLVTVFGASLGLAVSLGCELQTFSQGIFVLLVIASLVILLACIQFRIGDIAVRRIAGALWFVAIPVSCIHLCFCWSLYKANDLELTKRLSMSQSTKWNLQRNLFGTYFAVLDATKMAIADRDVDEAVAFVNTEVSQLSKAEHNAYERRLNMLYRGERWPELPELGVGAEKLARALFANTERNGFYHYGALQGLQLTLLSQNLLYEADFVTEYMQNTAQRRSEEQRFREPGIGKDCLVVESGYLCWLFSRVEDNEALRPFKWAEGYYPISQMRGKEWRAEPNSWNHCMTKAAFKSLLQLARASLKEKLKGVSMFPSNAPELFATLDRLKQVRTQLEPHGRYVAAKLPVIFHGEPIPVTEVIQHTAEIATNSVVRLVPNFGGGLQPMNRPVLMGAAPVLQGATDPAAMQGAALVLQASAPAPRPAAPVLQGVTNGIIGPAVFPQSLEGEEFDAAPVLQGATNSN